MRPAGMWLVFLVCSANACASNAEDDTNDPDDTDDTDGSADTDDSDTDLPEDTDTPTTPVAGDLSGLRWEFPCLTQTTPELCTTVDDVTDDTTLSGATGSTYEVVLRIRGIIEPKTYTGGTAGDGWNRDGIPANDTANIYALGISSPPATFYVNSGTTRLGSELYAEAIDFEMTIIVAGGATVQLQADSIDALQIRNIDENGVPIIVPDVPPAPDAYDGQFVQMDVVSVVSR